MSGSDFDDPHFHRCWPKVALECECGHRIALLTKFAINPDYNEDAGVYRGLLVHHSKPPKGQRRAFEHELAKRRSLPDLPNDNTYGDQLPTHSMVCRRCRRVYTFRHERLVALWEQERERYLAAIDTDSPKRQVRVPVAVLA